MEMKTYFRRGAVLVLIVCVLGFVGSLCAEAARAASAKPLLFLVAGQSNAKGSAEKPSTIVVPSGAFWNGQEWVRPLRDPVFPAPNGGFCPALAKSISDATGRKVYIVNVAVSASSSNAAYFESRKKSWSAYGRLRGRAAAVCRNAAAALNEPFDFGGVIWMQGEQEGKYYAEGSISLEDARQGFEDIFTWLADSFGRVFVIGIGYRNGTDRYDSAHEAINRLLKQAAGRIPHCYFASDMPMRLRSLGLMQEPVHGQNPHYLIRGYDLIGNDAGKYIASFFKEKAR